MSKDLVRDQFGRNAANYTTSKVHAKGASLQRLIELTTPQSSWRVLDVATATGHTAFAFAPHVDHVVASDLTPEMLVEARKLGESRGIANVSFAHADAEALPFDDQSFDLVTCRIAPHHFPSIPAFVGEVARVLKPGGIFALVDNLAPDQATNPDFAGSENAEAANAYNAFEKKRDPSHGRALTEAEWREVVTDSNLAVTHSEHLEKSMSFLTWCETMSVPAEVRSELRRDLERSNSALRAFLRPEPAEGVSLDAVGQSDCDIAFTLTELLLTAQRPSLV
ncbi:MAG: methyltransferase domain-containing protein [Pseudomonadota bacterium]